MSGFMAGGPWNGSRDMLLGTRDAAKSAFSTEVVPGAASTSLGRGRKALNSARKTELSAFGLAAFYRVPMNDLKVERLLSLKSLRRAQGAFGPWSGLTADDSPLTLRDVGAKDVYALE